MATSRSLLLLLVLIPLLMLLPAVNHVDAGVGCICDIEVTSAAGVLFACPAGDGPTLSQLALTISVTVSHCGVVNPGIPATDIWVIGCHDLLVLCGRGISASGPTDENGRTIITGDIAAGGCDVGGLRVVVQGEVAGAGVCADPCLPIKVKSADINGNLVVNLVDFAIFGSGYTSPPKPYNECIDYAAPFGTITIADFAVYGAHRTHSC